MIWTSLYQISQVQTALTSGLASTDELVLSDVGTLKRMDVSVLQGYLQSSLTFTTNTDTDVSVANLKTRLGGGFGSNIQYQLVILLIP